MPCRLPGIVRLEILRGWTAVYVNILLISFKDFCILLGQALLPVSWQTEHSFVSTAAALIVWHSNSDGWDKWICTAFKLFAKEWHLEAAVEVAVTQERKKHICCGWN